jgi:tetratricopeptide (TPR) repeat protein
VRERRPRPLRTIVTNSSIDAIELVDKLGHLPLALSLAGSYLNRTGVSVSKYIQLYTESWGELQRMTRPSRHHMNGTIETTWTISYEAVEKADEVAAKLLRLLACFDNHDVWFGLLENGDHQQAPEWFKGIVSSEMEFYKHVGTLRDYSLLDAEENKESYSMHPVVQSWCHEHLDRGQNDEFFLLALTSIASAIPVGFGRGDPQHRALLQRILPHANKLLKFLRDDLSEDYLREASIYEPLCNLGNLYTNVEKLAEAEGMYHRALAGAEKALGPDHRSTLRVVHSLGVLYSEQGKLAEAEAMCQRALAGSEKALGPDHSSTLEVVHGLAVLYREQGKLAEAEAMFQRALAGFEKALGPDHSSTLRVVHGLAVLYSEQGKLAEAEAMYQRALAGFEKALGPDHSLTLAVARNLGDLYSKQGAVC